MALRDYLCRQNVSDLRRSPTGQLTKCVTCDEVYDPPPFRISGIQLPEQCHKCVTKSTSIYEMIRPDTTKIYNVSLDHQQVEQSSEELYHQNKQKQHLRENYFPTFETKVALAPPAPPLQNGRPTPPATASPEPSPAVNINTTLRKRRHSNLISHHGAIRIDDRHQRQLVAIRDIAEGEIILRESPIVGGPMPAEFYVKKKVFDKNGDKEGSTCVKFKPICLACCRNVKSNYKCKTCGFPMCNLECEKHPDHADFECEVFATNPVAPIVSTNEYKKIKLLRCLLLRDKCPEKWQKIMDLDPHDEVRSGNLCAMSTTIALCKFIQQECHLKQFDVETINRVVGINTVHSLNTWNPSAYPITETQNNEITKATLLFYKAGLLIHDCKPNTRCIISQTGIGSANFIITVVASTTIPKGQVLSNCMVDVTRGTFQRRSELLESYYLACTCRRCMDPLEQSTFYSALKCPKCPNGHLLPGNPLSLDLSSVWLCNLAPRCDFIIVASQVMDLLRAVQSDVENAAVEHSLFQEYQNLQKVLAKYRGKILHKNHFYIMNIQYALIMVINQLLEIVNESEALRLSHQQIALCRSCIDVVDVLRPGNNRIRGNLLYFFHEGLLMTFLVEAKRRMSEPGSEFAVTGRKQFEDILNIMRIGRDCLILEPPGSPEHTRALKLSVESSGLQPLMRYFNVRT